MGDINAKSSLWGSPVAVRRGVVLSEWVSALHLVVLNEGSILTFQRGDRCSFIFTFASPSIAKEILS
nr:unnamed protein product [Callosobruchus analis]